MDHLLWPQQCKNLVDLDRHALLPMWFRTMTPRSGASCMSTAQPRVMLSRPIMSAGDLVRPGSSGHQHVRRDQRELVAANFVSDESRAKAHEGRKQARLGSGQGPGILGDLVWY
jgi:hypothetical protein